MQKSTGTEEKNNFYLADYIVFFSFFPLKTAFLIWSSFF